MSAVEEIASRLRRLEDEADVRELLGRYAAAIDSLRFDDWVDCFSPDGLLDVRAPGRVERIPPYGEGEPYEDGVRHRGAAKLRAFAEGYRPQPMQHAVYNVTIAPTGEGYAVDSCWAFIAEGPDGIAIRSFGRYADEVARGADGVMRLRTRVVDILGR